MSLKEVRQFAKELHKPRSDPPNPPNQQISSLPAETVAAKSKKANESAKLPEKYEILDKFFSSLDSSIRLARMKGGMSTFANLSPKIECLTDRRFTHRHLAQLKFILPEAIEISKVLVRDEHTCCMKPDLHITLNINAIQNERKGESDSRNLKLRKMFRARLFDFLRSHPQMDEVPEETLPEPFNHSKQDLPIINLTKPSTTDMVTERIQQKQPVAASHLSQFFKRQFSKKVSIHQAVNPSQEPTSVPLRSPMPVSNSQLDSKFTHRPPVTPIKELVSTSSMETPAKMTSTPAKLMSATPALQPSKRCYMSSDEDQIGTPNKLVRRPQRNRSLKFDTPVKNTKTQDDNVSKNGMLCLDDDILDILPDNLLESIREKERKALEEQSPAITEAKRRQKMIAGLPKLFDRLHFLYQSVKRSIMTKDELMHRIISSNLDIVERRDIEEQLRLLQELAPEWIYEKSTSSGDLLLGIHKISSPESIRARLAEAK